MWEEDRSCDVRHETHKARPSREWLCECNMNIWRTDDSRNWLADGNEQGLADRIASRNAVEGEFADYLEAHVQVNLDGVLVGTANVEP